MKDLIKKQEEYAEEFGYLHNEDCPINMYSPEECDCDNLKQVKHIMNKVRKNTAEYVCDKMTGKILLDDDGLSWNNRTEEENRIKQSILKDFK